MDSMHIKKQKRDSYSGLKSLEAVAETVKGNKFSTSKLRNDGMTTFLYLKNSQHFSSTFQHPKYKLVYFPTIFGNNDTYHFVMFVKVFSCWLNKKKFYKRFRSIITQKFCQKMGGKLWRKIDDVPDASVRISD